METEKILYKLIASGYKDYIKLMLGDTQIVYIKTTKERFGFIEQELRHMVDALNLTPILIGALKSIRGIEAWMPTNERNLTAGVYNALKQYDKTSLGMYNNSL